VKYSWRLGGMALLVCMGSAWSDNPKSGENDSKAILGSWQMISGELAGNAFPEEVAKSVRLVLSDGKYVVTVGKNPDEGTTKIDPTKDPKTLDILGVKGPNQSKTILAIYELKGDTLRVCYDLGGKERPKEFKSKPDTKLFLATYHREKP
jgi:uncharacterized protein (TIGR03067 family)